MVDLPKIKKKINSFLSKEDGKISKDKMIKTGVIVTTMGLMNTNAQAEDCGGHGSGPLRYEHTNEVDYEFSNDNEDLHMDTVFEASHTHSIEESSHSQHGSHSSHGSHGSHGSW